MALLPALWATGCASTGVPVVSASNNEVIVMGMIHSRHRTSKVYGIERIKEIVRQIDPDYILCEIPPDRLDSAMQQFRQTGSVAESRVKRFPEYVDAVFPLSKNMRFTLVPCAAWTKQMADDRKVKLQRWRTTRPDDYAEMQEAEERADRKLKELGLDEDPLMIHTSRYDEITKEGLEPYNRLFNDDLGAGGWDNINKAHYALISRALDDHAGEGKRFLIMFGAGHKHWFLERLRARDDCVLREVREFVRLRSREGL